MGVANWFKNIFKGKETIEAQGLESRVNITIKVDDVDYFLVLMVLNGKIVKYVYFKDGYLPIDVDLEDPKNGVINDAVNRAINEFMKQ